MSTRFPPRPDWHRFGLVDSHNKRVRERGLCDCPCHRARPELCDCGLWPTNDEAQS